jgi:DNA-binding NarL/FixJ family response regulator
MHNVPEELNAAIQKVLGGGKYTSASLAEKLALDLQPDIETPLHEKLSDREYQVLCLLASGLTIKQIGEKLCLSAKTVSTYRTRIMKKMKLKNLTGLIRYALQNRLLAINSGP